MSKPIGHRANDEAITIKRGNLCYCLLLMAATGEWADDGTPLNKWARLHDQLRKRLDEHDEKAKERGWRD